MKNQVIFLRAWGSGSGPFEEARALLRAVEARFGDTLLVELVDAGGDSWDPEVLASCRAADVVFTGDLGGSRRQLGWRLRRDLGVPARVRGVRSAAGAAAGRGQRPERPRALDMLLVSDDGEVEAAEMQGAKVREVAQVAAALAQRRWGLLTLAQSPTGSAQNEAWAAGTQEAAAGAPSIRSEVVSVEEAVRRITQAPGSLDVVLAETRVADVLWDSTAPQGFQSPVAFLGEQGRGLYPLDLSDGAQGILSVAMALRCSLRMEREATAVEGALGAAWAAGAPEGAALWEAVRTNLIADLTTSLAI